MAVKNNSQLQLRKLKKALFVSFSMIYDHSIQFHQTIISTFLEPLCAKNVIIKKIYHLINYTN